MHCGARLSAAGQAPGAGAAFSGAPTDSPYQRQQPQPMRGPEPPGAQPPGQTPYPPPPGGQTPYGGYPPQQGPYQPGYQNYPPGYPTQGMYPPGGEMVEKNSVGTWGLALVIIAWALYGITFLMGVVIAAQSRTAEEAMRSVKENIGLVALFSCSGIIAGIAGVICSGIGLSARHTKRTAATVGLALGVIFLVLVAIATLYNMANMGSLG